MKAAIFILLICSHIWTLGQYTEVYKIKESPHEMYVEIDYISIAIGYGQRIADNWSLGGKIGFGASHNFFTLDFENDKFYKLLQLDLLGIFKPSRSFNLELGYNLSAILEYPLFGVFSGLYMQPMVGWKELKFGTRFSYGSFIFEGNRFFWTPILLRIDFKL